MAPIRCLDPGSLTKLLVAMPDGWGSELRPAIHPHSVGIPKCPRRFLFSKRLGWYKRSWSDALYVGSIFHEILALRYAGHALLPSIESVLQDHTIELERQVLEYRAAHPDLPAPKTDKSRKALALGAALAQTWEEHFPLPANMQILAVEQSMARPLDDINVGPPVEGTVDLVVYDPQHARTWLVDHKTTAYDPATRAAPASFDTQMLLYRALWDSTHPDYPLFGVIHGIIRKPTIRQKKNETLEAYTQRCSEWYDEKFISDPSKSPLSMSHVAFTRLPLTQDAELCGLLRMTGRWHTKAPSLASFPRDSRFCINLSGRLCPYMSLCQQDNPNLWCGILQREGFTKRSQNTYPKAVPALETPQ